MHREEEDKDTEAAGETSFPSKQGGLSRLRFWNAESGRSPSPSAAEISGDLEEEETCRLLLAHTDLGFRHKAQALGDLGILWCLLNREVFSGMDERASALIGSQVRRATQKAGVLRPGEALMALALWRHGDQAAHEVGRLCLCARPLPSDRRWIYELTQVLGRDSADRDAGRGRHLGDLARLLLGASFFDSCAHLVGFFLVRRLDRWVLGSADEHLLGACDAAACQDPFRWAVWLKILARCAKDGALRHGWLEKPVEAAIRLHVDDPAAMDDYRRFHARRLYEVDSERVRDLYRSDLGALRRRPKTRRSDRVFERLVGEMDKTSLENPYRAIRLGECILDDLDHSRDQAQIDAVEKRLVPLYVSCLCIGPAAVARVRGHDLSGISLAHREVFFRMADYHYGFEGVLGYLAGVELEHLDKDAAYRVLAASRRPWTPHPVVSWIGNSLTDPVSNKRESKRQEALLKACGELLWTFSKSLVVQAKKSTGALGLAGQPSPAAALGPDGVSAVEARMAALRHRALLFAIGTGSAAGWVATDSPFLGSILQVLSMATVVDGLVESYRVGFDLGFSDPDLRRVLLGRIVGDPHGPMYGVETRGAALFVQAGALVGIVGSGRLETLLDRSGLLREVFATAKRETALEASWSWVQEWGRVKESPRDRHWMQRGLASLLGAFVGASLVYDCCEAAELMGVHSILSAKYPDWRVDEMALLAGESAFSQ